MIFKKDYFWKLFYQRWGRAPGHPETGYTLLFTVPPDLPVFLKIAVEICRRQDLTHLAESLVIPDHTRGRFRGDVGRLRTVWPEGRLRLVDPRPVDYALRRLLDSPHAGAYQSLIHFIQLVNGVNETRTTHALLHDADLFLFDRTFLRTHYESCVASNLACVGLDPPRSGFNWSGAPGFEHLVASWELMFSVAWMREFRPFQMAPLSGRAHGLRGWFMTTLLAQALTRPERVRRRNVVDRYVHFGLVISRYRKFQRAKGPYLDDEFTLLLIRLLIEGFDPAHNGAGPPPLEDLVRGLTDPSRAAFYSGERNGPQYPGFRGELERLFGSGAIGDRPIDVMRRGLVPFDGAFAWSSSRA